MPPRQDGLLRPGRLFAPAHRQVKLASPRRFHLATRPPVQTGSPASLHGVGGSARSGQSGPRLVVSRKAVAQAGRDPVAIASAMRAWRSSRNNSSSSRFFRMPASNSTAGMRVAQHQYVVVVPGMLAVSVSCAGNCSYCVGSEPMRCRRRRSHAHTGMLMAVSGLSRDEERMPGELVVVVERHALPGPRAQLRRH